MKSSIPENRASFSLSEVAQICGGTLTGEAEVRFTGIVTDSRAPTAGKLFVALSGERYDGHAFVSHAERGGARALLLERDVGSASVPQVRVDSTLRALGRLAQEHRRRWGGRLIAVGGSAGKTTTRSAIGVALEAVAPGRVHSVEGNLNNQIGVPMVLFGLGSEHRYGVVELGTNAPGEIAELATLCRPDLGVLTLIGLEHTELLRGIDQIEIEEASLFSALSDPGIAIGNADDERVQRRLREAPVARHLSYGFSPVATYRILEREVLELGGARLRLGRPERPDLILDCPLLGKAGASALAAGVAAAEAASGEALSPGALSAALQSRALGEPGRLSLVPLGSGVVVIDDSYNSNPASLMSSVAASGELAQARRARLVLLLGEMRELGEDSPRLHREAGVRLLDARADAVVAVGGDARWLLEPLEERGIQVRFSHDVEEAEAFLGDLVQPNDVVLVKGSRALRLERLVSALIDRHGRAP